MSEKPKGWAKLKLLLVPEIAFGYFLAGLVLLVGGSDWGWLLSGAGMGVMLGLGFSDV